MVVMCPEQPHTAEHAVVGRADDGSPFGSYYAMAHLELGLQIRALTTYYQWSDLQQVIQISQDSISSSLK